MDYMDEFLHMRTNEGLRFCKERKEIVEAIDQRIVEIRKSIQARSNLIEKIAKERGYDLDGLMARARLVRIDDLNVYEYEEETGILLGNALAIRIEDESITGLRFIVQHLGPESDLSFRSLIALFRPYSPEKIDSDLGLTRIAQQQATARARVRRRKHLRDEDDVLLTYEDFLARW